MNEKAYPAGNVVHRHTVHRPGEQEYNANAERAFHRSWF
jgi:hypothetical protein